MGQFITIIQKIPPPRESGSQCVLPFSFVHTADVLSRLLKPLARGQNLVLEPILSLLLCSRNIVYFCARVSVSTHVLCMHDVLLILRQSGQGGTNYKPWLECFRVCSTIKVWDSARADPKIVSEFCHMRQFASHLHQS